MDTSLAKILDEQAAEEGEIITEPRHESDDNILLKAKYGTNKLSGRPSLNP